MFYGEKLQLIRKLHSLSRKDVGSFIEVSEQNIWHFEMSRTAPTFEHISELSNFLM